jgi:hypothetical protein
MKSIFTEVGTTEVNNDNNEIREIWLPKFNGKPRELLEAILIHKRLDRAKWCKLTGTVYSSSAFDRAITEFKKLKLVSKQGNDFVLQL